MKDYTAVVGQVLAGVSAGEGWEANSFCPDEDGAWDRLKIGEHVLVDGELYVRYGEWEEYSCGVECCGWASYGLSRVTFK